MMISSMKIAMQPHNQGRFLFAAVLSLIFHQIFTVLAQ